MVERFRRTQEDSSSEIDEPMKKSKRRKRRNVFLDDEAECDQMEGSEDEMENTESDKEFIDDEGCDQDSQSVEIARKTELELNKIALLTFLQEMTNEELETMGMKFDLTKKEELFE